MRKKVLIQVRDLRVGNGIAAVIMNYYEYTVKNGYQIDFLMNRVVDSPYMDTVKKYDSNIYVLPKDTSKPYGPNYKYIKTVLNNGYDIVHVNISGLNALMTLKVAKQIGVEKRIYHAHNPKETSSLKAIVRSEVYEVPCVKLANCYAACSDNAGQSLFGKEKYTVLRNAMDIPKYKFDEEYRNEFRKKFNLNNKFVVGVVGRFNEQKNPFFTVDVFEEVCKQKDNSHLIWCGDGILEDKIKEYVDSKGLHDKVTFLGIRNDVNKLYSVMDVFLLPSKFEGLGLVFIEAQVSGLTCFGSDKVPVDVEVTQNINRLSLNYDKRQWADIICNTSINENSRKCLNDSIYDEYDIYRNRDGMICIYQE